MVDLYNFALAKTQKELKESQNIMNLDWLYNEKRWTERILD
jgi:hypothetical protein